jgi:hypothetical protein
MTRVEILETLSGGATDADRAYAADLDRLEAARIRRAGEPVDPALVRALADALGDYTGEVCPRCHVDMLPPLAVLPDGAVDLYHAALAARRTEGAA